MYRLESRKNHLFTLTIAMCDINVTKITSLNISTLSYNSIYMHFYLKPQDPMWSALHWINDHINIEPADFFAQKSLTETLKIWVTTSNLLSSFSWPVYMYHKRHCFLWAASLIFLTLHVKRHHSTALNPSFKWYKNSEVDGTCKRSLTLCKWDLLCSAERRLYPICVHRVLLVQW